MNGSKTEQVLHEKTIPEDVTSPAPGADCRQRQAEATAFLKRLLPTTDSSLAVEKRSEPRVPTDEKHPCIF